MKTLASIGVALLALVLSANGSERLNPDLLKSVVQIETPPNAAGLPQIGCGFLAGSDPAIGGRVFLVTNKHVVGDWNYADGDIQIPRPWIKVYFYRKALDSSGKPYRPTKVSLVDESGKFNSSKVFLHKERRVDVVAIDITEITKNAAEQLDYIAYDESYFIPFNRIEQYQTGTGDEVIALGYPFGIRSLRNNYPVAKIARVASTPGQELSLPFPAATRRNVQISNLVLEGKFLLLDGLITNGNSGGPVVLMGGVKVSRDPKTNQLLFTNAPIPNYVVGIVSGGYPGSGLSIVVSSDYILELIAPKEKFVSHP